MGEVHDFIYPSCLVQLMARDHNCILLAFLQFPSVYSLPSGSPYELECGTACSSGLFICKEESLGCILNHSCIILESLMKQFSSSWDENEILV